MFVPTRGTWAPLAAKQAIRRSGKDVVLTARAECFLVGRPDPLNESVRRLKAYSDAGADVLFAPGIRTREQIQTVVEAVRPKPVNVLVSSDFGLTVADLAALGVRRISVGSAFARSAWTGFMQAAQEIAEKGSFEALGRAVSFGDINGMFQELPQPL